MFFSVSEAFYEGIDAPQSVPELPAASRNRNTKKALFGYDLVIGVLVTGLQPLGYVCVPLGTANTLPHSHSRHVRLVYYGETIAKIAVYGQNEKSR